MKILILGDGLLGTELMAQTDWDVISRKSRPDFDLCNINSLDIVLNRNSYDTIVNCVAHTETYSDEREKHWETNYIAVMDLVDKCNDYDVKLVNISTDYIYANSVHNATEDDIPVHNRNWYSYTKLLGDAYVQARAKNYLMFRCSFKPRPWKYDNAIASQYGNFDYVDVIAKQMINMIEKNATGVYNIGTKAKTIYELAKETKPDVEMNWNLIHPTQPEDITMDLTKFNERMKDGLQS